MHRMGRQMMCLQRARGKLLRLAPALLVGLAMVGCGEIDPLASEDIARGASSAGTVRASDSVRPGSAAAIDTAMRNPRRRAADRERDERRQAASVLEFFGIQPGMSVLDLYSGGGYYTELLSFVVGDEGRVVAHNNTPYLTFARDELDDRYSPDRLTNVERLVAENNELRLPAETFDAVLMILAYHDVYYVDEASGWTRIDGPKLLAEIHQSMKPGAMLGVIDHAAEGGAPAETGGTLHRIDPALLKADITAAGFNFEAESNILRNPADDRSRSPFDPALRGRTDRVVFRFRKPW